MLAIVASEDWSTLRARLGKGAVIVLRCSAPEAVRTLAAVAGLIDGGIERVPGQASKI